MASSSQPNNQPLPYEVFINFRGDDTRNTFARYLQVALVNRGIQTYFDEKNLQNGQTIGDALKKAIKESRIAIVVLSENYGSSTWCLNELVEIMECKNKSGLMVIPIFYHVDPSVVRKQENSFSEAFSRYDVDFRDEDKKVKSWREALTQVSNLSGEHIGREQNEAACIAKIVDDIIQQRPVKASNFRKSCVGIESCISEIKTLMENKPHEVLFIGLWGMAGIGKTRMARAIFEDCKDAFQGSCFLENVKEKDREIYILQKNLLEAVLKMKLNGINDKVTGSSMIEGRLQCLRVLLVIDDVNNIDQLNALANQRNWFGEGSRIIITTRDTKLINEVYIKKFEVQLLPSKEALRLFRLHAFKNDPPHEEFEDFSRKILSYASGLPLALSLLGERLHSEPKHVWEGVVSKLLKDGSQKNIMETLLMSFDGLDDAVHQDIFLDIACFFRGYPKAVVEERLEGLGLYPEEGINRLCQRSLIYLKIDEDIGFHVIEMHDLLQEMGWYINRKRCARRSSDDDVRKYSRLWLEDDIVEVFQFTK